MRRNTKKSRYHAIFSQAAKVISEGSRAIIRPESTTGTDIRTICNYWYEWRKIYYGVGIKSQDPEVRRKATTVLDAYISVDTDNNGRVILVIEPRITPALQHTIEQVVQPTEPVPILSTGSGHSAPSAPASEADYFLTHTKPWQDWFKAQGHGPEAVFRCLDLIPRDMRANPDLAALDDLPEPNSAAGEAWKQKFKETLS